MAYSEDTPRQEVSGTLTVNPLEADRQTFALLDEYMGTRDRTEQVKAMLARLMSPE